MAIIIVAEKSSVIDASVKTLNDALSRGKFSWKDFRDTEAVQRILT